MITISKELFIETIKALEQQEKHDQECVKAFKVLLPNDYTTRYKNDWVIDQLIKNLQQATNDTGYHSWIEYFIYELKFGKIANPDSVQIHNKPYLLNTPKQLWKLLNLPT